jgi:hypothetical protein
MAPPVVVWQTNCNCKMDADIRASIVDKKRHNAPRLRRGGKKLSQSLKSGTDTLATFPPGTCDGLANPNYNRLTFFWGHNLAPATSNHYHRFGAYALTGSAASPSIIFANARIPEGSHPNLPLQTGSGAFSGKLVSSPILDPVIRELSHLTIAPIGNLAAYNANGIPNEPEDYLFKSSAGRYSSSIAGTDPHLQLVCLTPGLNVGDAAGTPIFVGPGDEHHLENGDTFAPLTPWFWTDASAAPAIYSATFKITDEAGLFGNSREFRWEFQVVPEPGSGTLPGASWHWESCAAAVSRICPSVGVTSAGEAPFCSQGSTGFRGSRLPQTAYQG